MSFKIKTAKVTDTPDANSWSQVHDFIPEDKAKLKRRGRIVAVISTRKQDVSYGENSPTLTSVSEGREVLSRLHEEYYGNLEDDIFNALKNSVAKVLDEFSNDEEIEIAVCATVDSTIYLAAGGGAEIRILREGRLVRLLSSEVGKVRTASGNAKKGDKLVMATRSFFAHFAGRISTALIGRDIDESAEIFAQMVHSAGNGNSFAVALMSFDESEQKDVQKISKQEERISPSDYDKSQEGALPAARQPEIYVEKAFEKQLAKRKKTLVSVGVMLVVLLIISIFFGIRRKAEIELRESYEGQLQEAQHLLEESLNLYSVDESRARQLFREGKIIVDSLVSQGIEDDQLDTLQGTVDENTGRILGEYYVPPQKLVDLSLLTKDFNGEKVVASDDTIFVMDSDEKKIASVSFDGKNSQVVAGPNKINEIDDLVIYADRVFVVNSKGVYEIEGGGVNLAIDRDWEGDVVAASFAGNIYVVDKKANEILRFAGLDEQFAAGQNWLASGVETDMSGAKDIAIDGYIWILNGTDILKFSLGNPQRFNVEGVNPSVLSPKAIFTGDEIDYLYILDTEGGRVVVTDKDGNYVAQYISDEIKNAKDLAVSEKDKQIILLTGENLISIEIKHM